MSREQRIYNLMMNSLTPSHLEVKNESHQHQVAKGSETHFKLVIVSEQFKGLSSVKRHQMLYKLLAEELSHGLHALSMDLRTAEEWASHSESLTTPACKKGYLL